MKRKTFAIPIRRVDFSDTSQVVSFLTRDFGILDSIAKGAYREKNAFQGPFDLATLSQIVYIQRRGSEALAIITEATQMEGYRGIRQVWERHASASYILEFLRAVGTSGESAHDLFDLTHMTLMAIEKAEVGQLVVLLSSFELQTLRILGLSSEIRCCAECGRPWRLENRPVFFSPEVAGVLCPRCREARPTSEGRIIPGKLVRKLNDLGRLRGEEVLRSIDSHRTLSQSGETERLLMNQSPPDLESMSLNMEQQRQVRAILSKQRLFLLERKFRMLEYTALFF